MKNSALVGVMAMVLAMVSQAAVIVPDVFVESLLIASRTPTINKLVATGGNVVVYYLGSEAAQTSVLRLGNTEIFSNKDWNGQPASTAGQAADLGVFANGTVLDFRLDVYETWPAWTGKQLGEYRIGEIDAADNHLHASLTPWTAQFGIPNGVLVGFEDLNMNQYKVYEDYNDHLFVFTNVRMDPPPADGDTPEPETWAMMGTGVALVLIGKSKEWFNR